MLRTLGRTVLAAILFLLAAPGALAEPLMRIEASARQPDGKILVAGQSPTSVPRSITVGRLLPSGAMDLSFGGGGWTQFGPEPAPAEFRVTAIATDSAGRIVVAAVRDGTVALVRFEAGGALDTSFASGGMLLDDSPGLALNALGFASDGGLYGFGSYTGSLTSGVTRAAVVKYQAWGWRDEVFGVQLLWGDESAIRSAARDPYGAIALAGYSRAPAGDKRMLAGRYLDYGALDTAFGGGMVSFDYVAGWDDEAFAVAADPVTGGVVVAGRDGHLFGSSPGSAVLAVWFDAFGSVSRTYREGFRVDSAYFDATVRTIEPIPGSGSWLAGAVVVDITSGAAHFALARIHVDNYQPGYSWQRVGPMRGVDDVLAGAYANAEGTLVAVGTAEEIDGDRARRVRYFSDNGELDTDFAQEGNDSTPNPFAFQSSWDASASVTYSSYPVRISGIDVPAAVSVTGGEYSIDCVWDAFTSAPGTIVNAQTVCVRQTSASTPNTTTSAVLTVGGVTASYDVTTGGPPETWFYTTPPATTTSTNAQFGIGGTNQSFQCSLDGAPFAACPTSLTGLAIGIHTYQARASNAWGPDPTPASYTWEVIGIADTAITAAPPASTMQTSATFEFVSNPAGATFECRLDGDVFSSCASPKTYTGLAYGAHTFSVRAVNGAGADATPATHAWTVDRLPPTTTVTSGPWGDRLNVNTATFTFTVNEAGATTEYSLNGAPYVSATSPLTVSNLPEGEQSLNFRSRDAAGNQENPGPTRTWSVDTIAPDTFISGTSGTVTTNQATFTFTSNDPTIGDYMFECRIDDQPWSFCPATITRNVGDGPHTVEARAQDRHYNKDPTPATHTWTVDMPVPETAIDSGPSGTVTSDSALFILSTDNYMATFECSLDGAPFAACAVNSNSVSYSGLAHGEHTFAVRARLSATKVDPTPATRTWIVDLAPQTYISSGPSGTVNQASATFEFSSSPAAAGWECRLDAGAWVACTTPATYSGLASAAHVFEVRGIDSQGRTETTPASRAWTVDQVPPETTITSGPSGSVRERTATFTFASSEAGGIFVCSIDGGPFLDCTSPKTYENLADGAHRFIVYAYDSVWNLDPDGTVRDWTVDNVAPIADWTSGPSGTVSATTATFTFAANEAATFTCALDGGVPAACTSPAAYPGLADGSHALTLVATDAAGNTSAPIVRNWAVDSTSPETTLSDGPSGTVAVRSATFAFTSPDPAATFECSLDAGPFTACTSPHAVEGLADGMHMFEARAVDAVGNRDASPASRTWAVDATQPNTTITSGPAAVTNETGATFTFTSTEAGSFVCRLDGGAATPCASPTSFVALAGGSHAFTVQAVDGAGNEDPSAATWSWFVDATAPETTITSAPAGTVASSSAGIAFASNDPSATFECRLDNGTYEACVSPVALGGLANGGHTFEVRARDAAGNFDLTPASASWTVDAEAPETSMTASPPALTNATSASFSFAASEAGTFECQLDNGGFAACTSPQSYTGLSAGSHTFQVRARDAAGNTDATPAGFTWTIDTTAPNTTIASGPNGNNNAQPVTFTFTSSEPEGTFECRMDTAAFAPCASGISYSGLAKGQHTFQVRAIDAAGNVDASPAARNFGVK